MTKEQQFYLVDFSILPEAIKKTIRVRKCSKAALPERLMKRSIR